MPQYYKSYYSSHYMVSTAWIECVISRISYIKSIDVSPIQKLIHVVLYLYFAVSFRVHVRLSAFYEGLCFGNSGNSGISLAVWQLRVA